MASWRTFTDMNLRKIESAFRADLQFVKNVASDFVFSVFLPPGKPPESAQKIALQFYGECGLTNAVLLEERSEAISNIHLGLIAENGSLLTDRVLSI